MKKLEATTILTRGGSALVRSSVSKNRYSSSSYYQPPRKPTPAQFGIGSVSVSLAFPARKTRYLSSAYYPDSALSELLIIGRSKVQVLMGPPFLIRIIEL
jgi:hypothetical protein